VRRRARLRRNLRLLRTIVVAIAVVWLGVWGAGRLTAKPDAKPPKPKLTSEAAVIPDSADGIKIGTFLGDAQRRYYGKGPVPEKLDLIWKARIGSGWTNRKEDNKPVIWAGAGWTGQPTLVRDKGKLSLIINGYDHRLHRYDAATGDTIWEYAFDDVIKSTNTVFVNPRPTGPNDRLIVTAGSRRGLDKTLSDASISSYRAVSFATGKELWRMPVPRTANYSRDVDASGIFDNGVLYEAVEPGYVYKLDPSNVKPWGGDKQPMQLARSRTLWDPPDVAAHSGEPGGSNLCIEGSPALSGNRVYVATGSGHVYGLAKSDLSVEWDFKVGTDFDSTPVITRDNRMLVGTERQYAEHGGVFMLDPSKPPKDAVDWWFPTQDKGIAEWNGGVVGSVAVNDTYDADGTRPALAAFNSVDGNLYVVSQTEMDGTAAGPHDEKYRTPQMVFRGDIGGGISTPIIVDDYIVTTGYDQCVHVYRIDYASHASSGGAWLKSRDGRRWYTSVHELATFKAGGSFEATPIVWKGRIYVASRDGYLYCLGDGRQKTAELDASTAHGD
jgi:outer membrane protein assembly factor BamB